MNFHRSFHRTKEKKNLKIFSLFHILNTFLSDFYFNASYAIFEKCIKCFRFGKNNWVEDTGGVFEKIHNMEIFIYSDFLNVILFKKYRLLLFYNIFK